MKYLINITLTMLLIANIYAADKPSIRLVPTLENCSVYIENSEAAAEDLNISYRLKGSDKWLAGHKLVSNQVNPTPRSSIFHLTAGTEYEVQCSGKTGDVICTNTFRTWSDTPPIAKTIYLKDFNPSGGPLLIDNSGSESGWIRYVGGEGYVINGGYKDNEAILFDHVKYVILENVRINGGYRHGILLNGSQNIRIRNCDISGWGRVGKQLFKEDGKDGKFYLPGEKHAINYDAGISIENSGKLVIENNYIHDPRIRANSWFYSHPSGPCAIFVHSTGETVIRDNDFPGSNDHRWNDVIEGWGNGKSDGGFNRDSDIYGNYMAFGNDDGIELDGGQCNVRFYDNKIEGTLCGVSTAANLVGPSFIMRNLIVNLGDERGAAGSVIKNGGGNTYTKGKSFFYHNTFFTNGKGISGVGYGKDDNRAFFIGESRNNILATSNFGIYAPFINKECSFDYDTFATPSGQAGKYSIAGDMEQHGIKAAMKFKSVLSGNFMPEDNAQGSGDAAYIKGYSDSLTSQKLRGAIGENGQFFPLRNNGLTTDKNQIIFSINLENDKLPEAEFNISLSKKFPNSKKFTILKNSAFNWLEASPKSGTLKPGTSLKVKIALNKSGFGDRALLPACLIIKLESGESLPVTVYTKIKKLSFNEVHPAISCTGADNFKTANIPGGPKQGCIEFTPENPQQQGKNKISCDFTIPSEGNYCISVLTFSPAPEVQHDSMFISINGQPAKYTTMRDTNGWQWNDFTINTRYHKLPKGKLSVTLYPREQLYLGAIKVSAVETKLPGEK